MSLRPPKVRCGIEKIIEINRADLITNSSFRLASRRKLQKFSRERRASSASLRMVLPKNSPNYSTAYNLRASLRQQIILTRARNQRGSVVFC